MNAALLLLQAPTPTWLVPALVGVIATLLVVVAALLARRRPAPAAEATKAPIAPSAPPAEPTAASAVAVAREAEAVRSPPAPKRPAREAQPTPADRPQRAATAAPEPAPVEPVAPAAPLSAPVGSVNSLMFALGGLTPESPNAAAPEAQAAPPTSRPTLPGMGALALDGPLLAMPAHLSSPAAEAPAAPYTPSFNSLMFNLSDMERAGAAASAELDAAPAAAQEEPVGLSFDSLAFGLQEGAPDAPVQRRAAPPQAEPADEAPQLTAGDLFGAFGAAHEEEPAPAPRLMDGIALTMSPFGAGQPGDAPGRFDVSGEEAGLEVDALGALFGSAPEPHSAPAPMTSDAEALSALMTGTMMGAPSRAHEDAAPAAPQAAMGVFKKSKPLPARQTTPRAALADEVTAAGDTAEAAFVRMPTKPELPSPAAVKLSRPPERQMTPLRSVPNKVMQLSMRSSTHASVPTTSEDEIARLYREFLQALKACGQQGGALMSFEVFHEKIRQRREKIRQKHGIHALAMEILIKDGRPLIEIRPRG